MLLLYNFQMSFYMLLISNSHILFFQNKGSFGDVGPYAVPRTRVRGVCGEYSGLMQGPGASNLPYKHSCKEPRSIVS
jgi:hypothetical protein